MHNIEKIVKHFLILFMKKIKHFRGVSRNSGLGGARFKSGPFLYHSDEGDIKSLMFLYHVINIEHNLKQNIYTGMEVISLLPP